MTEEHDGYRQRRQTQCEKGGVNASSQLARSISKQSFKTQQEPSQKLDATLVCWINSGGVITGSHAGLP